MRNGLRITGAVILCAVASVCAWPGVGAAGAKPHGCPSAQSLSHALGVSLRRVHSRGAGKQLACSYNNGHSYDDPRLPRTYAIPGPSSIPPASGGDKAVPGLPESQYSTERQNLGPGDVAYLSGGFCRSPRGGTLLIQTITRNRLSDRAIRRAFKALCA